MPDKGQLTKRNIIGKSLQLFSVKGYYNTSINDILDATGLKKGGLYGHFAGKEAIWIGICPKSSAGINPERTPCSNHLKNIFLMILNGPNLKAACFYGQKARKALTPKISTTGV